MYGTVLNSGSDEDYWACMNGWYQYQGYEVTELPYLLEANMAEGTVSPILTKDVNIMKGLNGITRHINAD